MLELHEVRGVQWMVWGVFLCFFIGMVCWVVWRRMRSGRSHVALQHPSPIEPSLDIASTTTIRTAATADSPKPPKPPIPQQQARVVVQQPPETQIKFQSAQTPNAKQFWPDSDEWPFVAINPVITPPEQVLYRRLLEALPECMVLAQVQLSRVLGVKDGHPFHTWNNRISRMSLDFVVCRWNGRLVAVIELDDRSHERSDRIEADAKKDAALAAAGVPIIRWKVHAMPDHAQIRQAVRACGMEI